MIPNPNKLNWKLAAAVGTIAGVAVGGFVLAAPDGVTQTPGGVVIDDVNGSVPRLSAPVVVPTTAAQLASAASVRPTTPIVSVPVSEPPVTVDDSVAPPNSARDTASPASPVSVQSVASPASPVSVASPVSPASIQSAPSPASPVVVTTPAPPPSAAVEESVASPASPVSVQSVASPASPASVASPSSPGSGAST